MKDDRVKAILDDEVNFVLGPFLQFIDRAFFDILHPTTFLVCFSVREN